jgi:hypothetical protein
MRNEELGMAERLLRNLTINISDTAASHRQAFRNYIIVEYGIVNLSVA